MKYLSLLILVPVLSYADVSPKSVDSYEAYFSYKGCEYGQNGVSPEQVLERLKDGTAYKEYTKGVSNELGKEYVLGFIQLGASRSNYYKRTMISCSEFFVDKLDEISAKYDQLLSKSKIN